MDLALAEAEVGGVPVLRITGELDVSTAPRVRERLVSMATGGPAVIDLDGLEFIDSTGLGVLVGGLKRFRTLGGDLLLVCTVRRIMTVFEITGLTAAFGIYSSVEEAVAAVPAA